MRTGGSAGGSRLPRRQVMTNAHLFRGAIGGLAWTGRWPRAAASRGWPRRQRDGWVAPGAAPDRPRSDRDARRPTSVPCTDVRARSRTKDPREVVPDARRHPGGPPARPPRPRSRRPRRPRPSQDQQTRVTQLANRVQTHARQLGLRPSAAERPAADPAALARQERRLDRAGRLPVGPRRAHGSPWTSAPLPVAPRGRLAARPHRPRVHAGGPAGRARSGIRRPPAPAPRRPRPRRAASSSPTGTTVAGWLERPVGADPPRRASAEPRACRTTTRWMCIAQPRVRTRTWDIATGNGYYGGLQMDRQFQQAYAPGALPDQGDGRQLDGRGADADGRAGPRRPGLHPVAEHRPDVRAALGRLSGGAGVARATPAPRRQRLPPSSWSMNRKTLNASRKIEQRDQRDVAVAGAAQALEVEDRQARRRRSGRRCTRSGPRPGCSRRSRPGRTAAARSGR